MHRLAIFALLSLTLPQFSMCAWEFSDDTINIYFYNGNITKDQLSSTSNAHTLRISNSNIEYIEPDAFCGLVNLEKLKLSSSNIPTITKDFFRCISSLKELSLWFYHEDVKIEIDAFSNLKKLTSFQLDTNNRFEKLTKETFGGTEDLKYLKLRSHLTEVDQDVFSLMPNIEYIYLSQNNIKSFPEKIFKNLNKVVLIDISFNPTGERFPAEAFDVLPSLTHIIAGGNKMTKFSNEEIKNISHLFPNLNQYSDEYRQIYEDDKYAIDEFKKYGIWYHFSRIRIS